MKYTIRQNPNATVHYAGTPQYLSNYAFSPDKKSLGDFWTLSSKKPILVFSTYESAATRMALLDAREREHVKWREPKLAIEPIRGTGEFFSYIVYIRIGKELLAYTDDVAHTIEATGKGAYYPVQYDSFEEAVDAVEELERFMFGDAPRNWGIGIAPVYSDGDWLRPAWTWKDKEDETKPDEV